MATLWSLLLFMAILVDVLFTTGKASEFTFVMLGDWGRTNDFTRANANAMGEVAIQIGAQFVYLLGDNFYDSGIANATDPRWQHGFEEIFTASSLSSIPFYATLGNHDYYGNESAQIAYYKTHMDKRWTMPDYNYTTKFLLPEDGGSLEIFAFDAVRVAYNASPDALSDISEEEKIILQQQQLNALEASLRVSDADWKIVTGHYPIYSAGEHGDTEQLIDNVVPLLKRYNVDMYMNGHDHTLQHISWGGIEYFTIGRGTNVKGELENQSVAMGGLLYEDLSIGFGSVTVTSNTLTVNIYNDDGNSMYAYTLTSSSNDESGSSNSACTSDEDGEDEKAEIANWIWQGGVVIFIIGTVACFWGLALVCDHYFCAALIILCEETKIPDDVAGATVMAIGTSAADLMISVISLFIQESTVGLGTIIGSEVFNHLIVSAACTMNSKEPIQLEPRLFTREVVSYCFTLAILMIALNRASFESSKYDECLSVSWYIGLVLMLFYIMYALVVIYYDKIMLSLLGPLDNSDDQKLGVVDESTFNPMGDDSVCNVSDSIGGGSASQTPRISESSTSNEKRGAPSIYSSPIHRKDKNSNSIDRSRDSSGSHTWANRSSMADIHTSMHSTSVAGQVAKGLNPLQDADLMSTKKYATIIMKEGIYYSTLPLRLMISYTIPDLTKEENRSLYIWAMFASIIWLGALAQGLLYCLDILGDMLGITDELMGLTIGAWGASMPTLWSSMVVAKKGFGDMALSNAIGANVFSVLVGLGLPWFSYSLFLNGPYNGIQDSGILPLLVVMLAITILYYFFIAYNKYVLEFWMGWCFLGAYGIIIALCTTIFDF